MCSPYGRCSTRVGGVGPILLIPTGILATIRSGRRAFLSRVVQAFDRGDATAIRIGRSGGSFAIEKRNGKWVLAEPTGTEADATAVEELLWGLCYVEARRIVERKPDELAECGLAPPRIRVAVTLASAPEAPSVLLIGKSAGEAEVYAMRQGGDRVYTIGKDLVELLAAQLTPGK